MNNSSKQSVPSRAQFYRMKAYAKIDQHLTLRELQKEHYFYKSVRDMVVSIGRSILK